jgi:galactose mutarotase-like enzyme
VKRTHAAVEETRFQGERALTLRAADLTATFVPNVGMTGVSLRSGRREHLALPGGLDALRAGHTAGLPLLAPWANRLVSRRYRAAGVDVDLRGLRLRTDQNGLPIHGLLVGTPGWRVDRAVVRGTTARLLTSIDVDARAFPFPHRIELSITAREGSLIVDTTIVPTGRRRVPVAFGWHPYLRVPGTPRRRWRLRLPARAQLALDDRGIPTGASVALPKEAAPIAARTFDDLYALGRGRRLAYEGEDGAAIELRCGPGYPHAQVWIPEGRSFGALEPMTAPTNALERSDTPLVSPGESFTARFALVLRGPGSSA